MQDPKSLQEAVLFFVDPDNCVEYLAKRRWPNGVVICPTCGSEKVKFNQDRRIWQCSSHHPKRQFSIKVGTLFEDSAIGLDKWLVAVWMLTNCKNGISSYELGKALAVTQKTAWFMLHRIRLGLRDKRSTKKMGGDGSPVEVDETYIGAKAKNMHKSRKIRLIQARNDLGTSYVGTNTGSLPGKTPIQGMLDRESRKVRATVVPNIRRDTLQTAILNHVVPGSHVFTDQAIAYDGLAKDYVHEVINHLQGYVRGKVHTNGMENFWSLLKRSLNGTYVSVEPFHLFRYVDEQVFRYNNRKDGNRKMTDFERFDIAVSQIVGKRLTFAELTGKTGETAF